MRARYRTLGRSHDHLETLREPHETDEAQGELVGASRGVMRLDRDTDPSICDAKFGWVALGRNATSAANSATAASAHHA